MTSDGPDAKKQKSDDDWRRTSFKIADVNPHLVCALCGGYFRDCHTITECLHSFCQVCILAHLRQNKNSCPRCGVDLGPHPMTAVLHDRQLQAVVDKIFPEFEDIDRQARQARRAGGRLAGRQVGGGRAAPVSLDRSTRLRCACASLLALAPRRRRDRGGHMAANGTRSSQNIEAKTRKNTPKA